ncbi:MAG: 2-hydroxyglutaryl-CoA dehydratase [Thermodesulfovibrionia bacterium]|nr:2-hydroxyglutaryl-CoA dehydratase [Thermodesulfovibrionia bacterium]
MKIFAGLDIGSLSTKTVIIDEDKKILSYEVLLTNGSSRGAAEQSFQNALDKAGLTRDDIDYIMTTGYGRNNIPFTDDEVSEITAHAKGAHFLFPEIRTVLDIGGQDSKAIKLEEDGQISDFVMNDKCAAGTGRFLEVMAQALGLSLESLSDMSQLSSTPTVISSFCAVFAESEVVSLVGEGREKEDIARGIHEAIVVRTLTLLNRVKMSETIAMTGGVAKNKGLVKVLEDKLKLKLSIPEEPQIIGALGAALIAIKKYRKKAGSPVATEKLSFVEA